MQPYKRAAETENARLDIERSVQDLRNKNREREKKGAKLKGFKKEKIDDIYSEEELQKLILGLNGDQSIMKQLGYEYIEIDNQSPNLNSYDGEYSYALPISVGKEDGSKERGWITVEIERDGKIKYVDNISGRTIQSGELSKSSDLYSWLKEESASTKVVKSRPMWMYPELFDLEPEEVWPKDKKIMVIGDPFQACDREKCTIVEYEYADEMVPPILPYIIGNKKEANDLKKEVMGWLKELYHEDIRALENMYSLHTPADNPYKAFLEKCFDLAARIATQMPQKQSIDNLEEEYLELQKLGQKLMDGSWTMEDGAKALEFPQDGEESEDLKNFYAFKEQTLEKNGDPKAWAEYVKHWNQYLDSLPIDYLKKRVTNFDSKIKQVQHWLEVLPNAKSPHRISTARRDLEDFLNEIWPFFDEDKPETQSIKSDELNQSFDKSFGTFGFFLPGHPMSLRNKKTLEEGLLRVEQMISYKKGLLPHLQKELERIQEAEIPLCSQTKLAYFSQLEQAWAQAHFFRRRTQRSVPIHGFFPYKMPPVSEQDRILALTSVTMHGWNSLDQEGFFEDISAAIPYLSIGGKYILGPINQTIYFGGSYSGFDTGALTRSLKKLASQGLIEYEFHKGHREYNDEYGDVSEERYYNSDNQILYEDESASCLVITRLK